MKGILSTITMLFLLIAFSSAHSEIYSWVDKEGKKHFGEKVPKEYLKQSSELEVKPTNGMDAAKPSPEPKAVEKTVYQRQIMRTFTPPQAESTEGLSACEIKKRAYQKATECYAGCRTYDGTTPSISACGHCVDAKKPNC